MLQSPGFVLPLDHDLEKFQNTCCTRLSSPFPPWLYPKRGYFPSVQCGPTPSVPEDLIWTFLISPRQWCGIVRQTPQSWCGNCNLGSTGTVYFCCICAGNLSVCVPPPLYRRRAGMGAPFGVGGGNLLPRLPEAVPWGCP